MISVVTFTNKMVSVATSVGTLYRECMVRVVFHYERLEITKEYYKQYCNINECISLPRKSPWGWFLARKH